MDDELHEASSPSDALSDVDLARVRRYLAGAASADDHAWIARWIGDDPRRRDLIEPEQVAGEGHYRPGPVPVWDTDASWRRLRARIQERSRASLPRAHDVPVPARQRATRRPAALVRPLRVAAILILALGAGLLWSQRGRYGLQENGPTIASVRSEPGQRMRARLPDGTAVVLAPGSRLSYPRRFDSDLRSVTLEGQAYFTVVSDSARPFVVRSGQSLTRVLGTEFSVRAYPRDGYVEVVVAQGRVSFGGGADQEQKGVILTPGYLARLSEDGTLTPPREADVTRSLAWLEGRLVFDDVALAEVARSLERHYGIRIEVAAAAAGLPLTADIRSSSASEAVRLVSVSLGLALTEEAGGYAMRLSSTGGLPSHIQENVTP